MSIGVFTFHDGTNYGATYQMYALQQVLKRYDDNVQVIDYIHEKRKSKLNARQIAFLPIKLIKEHQFENFRKRNVKFSKKYNTISIKENPPMYDVYVTGSDQVWNPRTMNEKIRDVYFLDVGNESTRRVAYAPSMGVSSLQEEDKSYIKKKLERIDCISVREETGKQLIKGLTDKEVKVTLDPTLLLTKEDWMKIEKNKSIPKEKYIFVYTIEPNNTVIKMINDIAKERNMKIVHTGFAKKYENEERRPFADPKEFLSLIHNADLVLTNSFHGTVFSLIYEKEFYSFSREGMNSRVRNLLEKLEISNRFIEDIKGIEKCSIIDYEKVNKLLQKEREDSIKYIEKSIKV